ncbi:MAG: hypothetical protein Q8Q00_13890 [Dehalococcoidia bacterium]|nr:hypothetical protein [Dehalococcoidia bacterium]
MTERAIERLPEFLRREAPQERGNVVLAELFLETHRVTGIVDQTGAHRRLVDLLNAADGPVLTVRDASVESLADPSEQPRRYQVLQVRRQSVLLALPLSAAAPPDHAPEAVEKRPTTASLLLPGMEVTGQIYLPPGADPGSVPILARHDFLPVTDAMVTQTALSIVRWEQPLVVVNLDRAILYAPALG